MSIERLRNIAIVAHLDHGKTTLVDCLLQQSGTFSARPVPAEPVMDSHDQAKESGLTNLSPNTATTTQRTTPTIYQHPGTAHTRGHVTHATTLATPVHTLF